VNFDRITLAVNNMDEMVEFYNEVFDAHLKPEPPVFFTGRIGDVELLLCPNDIAGVVAQQNRHQFRFVVENLEKVLLQVEQFGGQPLGDVEKHNGEKLAGARDPDGNTIEFVQRSNGA
jgi:predicted enzyme related to lactoylglutathione lyase